MRFGCACRNGILAAGILLLGPATPFAMNERILAFQEYLFGEPLPKVIVLAGDIAGGEFRILEESGLEQSGRFQTRGLVGDRDCSGFKPTSVFSSVYDMFYCTVRPSSKYSAVILDKRSGRIIRVYDELVDGGIVNDDLYYVEGMDMKKCHLPSGDVVVVRRGVTAIAVQEEEITTFAANGVIGDSSGRKIDTFDGVVTEAGAIDNEWAWFYLRKNERSLGDLYFFNPATKKRVKVRLRLPQIKLLGLVESKGIGH